MVKLNSKPTINEISVELKSLGSYSDDLFIFSFQADGKSYGYQVYNKGKGFDEHLIDNFSKIENVHFTDTVNKEDTDLLTYMKKHKFNPKNGDGELVISYDGQNKTYNMLGIHNTNLGPALGGLREKNYSNFNSMITDTLRLSKGMTYKGAMGNTRTGGGKSTRTIPEGIRKETNLGTARVFNLVNNKRKERGVKEYYAAEDSNTTSNDFDDMDTINIHTACKSLYCGGTGNPSPITAIGVYEAAKVGAEYAFPDKILKDKTVLISGVGQVGYELLKNFVSNGAAKVICAEMNKERIEWVEEQFRRMERKHKIEFMLYTKEQLLNQKFLHDLANEVDIFAPCALGRSINNTNIDVIKNTKLKMICGAENNQLADEEKHGIMLQDMGILYVPDYVANAGGLINCCPEIRGRMFVLSDTIELAKKIGNTVREVLEYSKKQDIPTYLAANLLAEKKFLKN